MGSVLGFGMLVILDMMVYRCHHTSGASAMDEVINRLTNLETGVEKILQHLNDPARAQEWFTVGEAAGLLGKDDYTVRQWCLERRCHAEKMPGKSGKWRIHRDEIRRIRENGLIDRTEH